MPGVVDLYRVLGVSQTAEPDEIRAGYKTAVKRVHPDVGGTHEAFLLVDAARRTIASGSSTASVVLPGDVALNAVLARTCAGAPVDQSIRFFPSGLSCGGTLILSRLGFSLQIRVDWLTGGVEIIPGNAA